MSNPITSPDTAWIVGTALGAVISAGPAYLAAKRSGHKIEHAEHATTRTAMVDALNAVVGPLNGRLDEMHTTIAEVRDWQTDHATEHAVTALNRPMFEYRKSS